MTTAKTFLRAACLAVLFLCLASAAYAKDKRQPPTRKHSTPSNNSSLNQNPLLRKIATRGRDEETDSLAQTPTGTLALPATADEAMDNLEGLEGSQVESFRSMLKNSEEMQKAYEQATRRYPELSKLAGAGLPAGASNSAASSAQFSQLYENALSMANQVRTQAVQKQNEMLREIKQMEESEGLSGENKVESEENTYRSSASALSPRYHPAKTKLSPMGNQSRSTRRRR